VNPDDVIGKSGIGYCADGNRKRMAVQLRLLLDDNKAWKRKSGSCIRYVKKTHDISKISAELGKALRCLR
jgi:hypothetical protein